jgi:hypothetical protein
MMSRRALKLSVTFNHIIEFHLGATKQNSIVCAESKTHRYHCPHLTEFHEKTASGNLYDYMLGRIMEYEHDNSQHDTYEFFNYSPSFPLSRLLSPSSSPSPFCSSS